MNADTLQTRVVIVGGGPVGLSMAIGLRWFGVDCIVLERHPGTLDFPKGRGVTARTMEIFRQWGFEDRVRSSGLTDESSFLFTAETLLSPEFSRVPIREVSSATVSPCDRMICAQTVLEPLLRSIARERGADLRFGHDFQAFETGPNGVTATVQRRSDGHVTTIEADYLVAADGSRSSIRDRLGIGVEGPGPIGDSISILVDAPLGERIADRLSTLYGVASPPGAGFAVVDNDRQWLLMMRRDVETEPEDYFTEERCLDLVRTAIGDSDVPVTYRAHRFWQPTAQWATAMSAGRVFLVGDSAHVTTPAGGLGMNAGIADAHNLAWKVSAVLAEWAPASLLDTYGDERLPVARQSAEASMAIGASIRDPNARRAAFGVTFGVTYVSSAIATDHTDRPAIEDPIHDYSPSGRPGVRAPHIVVDGKSLLDEFGTDFCVLIDHDHPQRDALVLDSVVPARIVALRGAKWREIFGIGPTGVVIVRPDGHISFRSAQCPDAANVVPAALLDSVTATRPDG